MAIGTSDAALITLIIPVYNEEKTIRQLVDTVLGQTCQPTEIIIVDGGSVDGTVSIVREIQSTHPQFTLIEAGRAMPGKGRNIGAAAASTTWIAFTDAGIKLEPHWLENLQRKALHDEEVSVVYGNYNPQINTFFEKCAAMAYVAGNKKEAIRGKTIVSCLLKKTVWQEVGGFPDWRAAEDLFFMEKIANAGFKAAYAPDALANWQLRQSVYSIYKGFDLYSKWNVWAGRQAYWHYGIGRQYLLMLLPVLLAFIVSPYWLLVLPLWILARVSKRILLHRNEFGWKGLFNPAVVFMVAIITLAIDAGTFSGWIKALLSKNELTSDKTLAV